MVVLPFGWSQVLWWHHGGCYSRHAPWECALSAPGDLVCSWRSGGAGERRRKRLRYKTERDVLQRRHVPHVLPTSPFTHTLTLHIFHTSTYTPPSPPPPTHRHYLPSWAEWPVALPETCPGLMAVPVDGLGTIWRRTLIVDSTLAGVKKWGMREWGGEGVRGWRSDKKAKARKKYEGNNESINKIIYVYLFSQNMQIYVN